MRQSGWLQKIVIYTLLFLVLYEWLAPVIALTNLGYEEYVLLFIGLAIVIRLTNMPGWLALPIQFVYVAIFLYYIYTTTTFVNFFITEAQSNILALIQFDLSSATNSFRTLLLFILIWMLIYLVHYWVTVGYSIIYFVLMTVIFVAALDAFTDYDGTYAIVRVMLYSFLLLGSLYIKRLSDNEERPFNASYSARLYIPFIMLVVGVIGIGIFLPKTGPTWADPIAFINKQINEQADDVQRTGYSDDDTQLGGSVADDSTLVFTAVTDKPQYWRIETKDTYTTKGWEQQQQVGMSERYQFNEQLLPVGTEYQTAAITNAEVGKQAGYIMQPYTTLSIDGYETIMQESVTGKSVSTNLDSYNITFAPPTFILDELQQATELTSADFSNSSINPYLELPELLPDRVIELAQEITANETSMYSKAKAIENYFKQNQFVYDKQNIVTPAPDQDYVDQFLFETKRGYCDNFSTAMTVMLRAVDVPARWTKGFAPGTKTEAGYQVTNNDAHSWVEAYIPGVGWLPFEPTIGFEGTNVEQEEIAEEIEPEETLDQEIKEQEQSQQNEAAAPKRSVIDSIKTWLKENTWLYYVAAIATSVIILAAIILRKHWLPGYYVRKYKRKAPSRDNFMKTYQLLVAQYTRFGYARDRGETLQQYAKRIDSTYDTVLMQQLTDAYTKLIYSEHDDNYDYAKLHESWEYLINRTTG